MTVDTAVISLSLSLFACDAKEEKESIVTFSASWYGCRVLSVPLVKVGSAVSASFKTFLGTQTPRESPARNLSLFS